VTRRSYPFDVSDEEWGLVAPYLALLPENAGHRCYFLRENVNGLRYVVKTGAPWRRMPNDLPLWKWVYQQTQRWLAARCFNAPVHDLRVLLRLEQGRNRRTALAVVIDCRTLQSTLESGHRAGWDGAKRREGLEGACRGGCPRLSAGAPRPLGQRR
jgi:transposase